MRQVSFPLFTFMKSGPGSVFDGVSLGVAVNFTLFFLVLFLFYLIIRRASNSGRLSAGGRNFNMVEKFPLGMDRYIAVFELQGVFYIIYMDKNGATLIDKRSDLSLPETQARNDFGHIFSSWMSKTESGRDEADDEAK